MIGGNGAAFGGPYNHGMGPLGSEPAAGIDGTGSTSAFWKGRDGNLWEAFWNGSAWVGPGRVAVGALG
jgi:hypothetical protein